MWPPKALELRRDGSEPLLLVQPGVKEVNYGAQLLVLCSTFPKEAWLGRVGFSRPCKKKVSLVLDSCRVISFLQSKEELIHCSLSQ